MARTIELREPLRLYIDGAWVEPSTSATIDVLNCATEEVVATVAQASSEDMRRAVAAARKAFDEGPWPRMAPEERAKFDRNAVVYRDLAKRYRAGLRSLG